MAFASVSLADLEIEDEGSLKHVALYGDLREVVQREGLSFLVPEEPTSFARALLVNLAFWVPGASDVLVERVIDADVVAHVAWHHLADRYVRPSAVGHLLGESIASAFDVYLVGRVLGHSPDSSFLATQVPRMAEVAEEAGVDAESFAVLLAELASEPERAFEDLRALLFDVSVALLPEMGPAAALSVLSSFEDRRFAPLLHHFELATWLLRARLDQARESLSEPLSEPAELRTTKADAFEVDRALRAADDAVGWLERTWVGPLLDAASLDQRGAT